MTKCNVCDREPEWPRSRTIDGNVVEQCVAKIHDGRLNPEGRVGRFHEIATENFRSVGIVRSTG